MEFQNFLAAVQLSRLPGVGAKRFKELIDCHRSPLSAWRAAATEQLVLFTNSNKARMETEIAALEKYFRQGGAGTYYGAPDYPVRLAQMSEPPPYLFRCGPLWPLETFAVAIVGRRQASATGCAFARELAIALTQCGVTVVSGGASGIDGAAHEGVLSVDGKTVLVSATGIDVVYPPENESLFERVSAQGCLLTELLPGTPPRRDFFPTRNRIIAGLTQALVVVEGKKKSGSASTYFHARKFGRLVFAWEDAPEEGAELPQFILENGGIALSAPDAALILSRILRSRPG